MLGRQPIHGAAHVDTTVGGKQHNAVKKCLTANTSREEINSHSSKQIFFEVVIAAEYSTGKNLKNKQIIRGESVTTSKTRALTKH